MREPETLSGGEILKAHGRVWPWAFAVFALSAYLLWAGSSWDPRSGAIWAFTGQRGILSSNGWLVPAPGLPHFLFASFLLCGALGRLAFSGMACSGMKTCWKIVSAILIFAGALAARMLVLHYWHPWTLSPEALTAAKLPPADIPGRWLGVIADMLTILLLLGAQFRKEPAAGRNLWLAAVYAFHPITLLAIAGGSRWLMAMPVVVFVVMFAAALRRWVRLTLLAAVALACSVLVARVPLTEIAHPFNGLLPLLFNQLGAGASQVKTLLIAIGIALETSVLLLAIFRRWPIARAWVHFIVIWAICSPNVPLPAMLPLIVLLPLAWSHAGALLTAVVLAAFGVVLSWTAGTPFVLPDWLIYITMLPVIILELEELIREAVLVLRVKRSQTDGWQAAAPA